MNRLDLDLDLDVDLDRFVRGKLSIQNFFQVALHPYKSTSKSKSRTEDLAENRNHRFTQFGEKMRAK